MVLQLLQLARSSSIKRMHAQLCLRTDGSQYVTIPNRNPFCLNDSCLVRGLEAPEPREQKISIYAECADVPHGQKMPGPNQLHISG